MKSTRTLCGILFLASVQWLVAQPVITAQPKNAYANPGATVYLMVSANSTNPPITYQWWFKEAAMDVLANPSAATSELSLTNVTKADEATNYCVVVSDLSGSVTSQVARLTVDPTTFTRITNGPPVTDRGNCWGGVSWGDYDGDGYPDLFVPRYQLGRSALYRNNGDGTFTSITGLPFTKTPNAASAAWADFDNDGRLDLLVAATNGLSFFYFNNGDGTFSTSQSQSPNQIPWNVAVADYNRDGLLDLFVAGSPGGLYRNNGDRTFTRMTKNDVGALAGPAAWGGAAWADYDGDGWAELFGPNYGNRPRFYDNDGTGRFVAVTNLVTQLGASTGLAGAWGDYDNDSLLDLCVANLGEASSVYRNLGNRQFEKAPIGLPSGIGGANSAAWADYDNDGFLDLFLTHGNALYHNNGDGTFTKVTTGPMVTDIPIAGAVSYSGLWFDYDNDGFLDLYVVNGADPTAVSTANFLYHNNGNSNAWLKVRLIGTESNRDAVGAKVLACATYAGDSRAQRRDITGGDVYNGNQLYAHFGLGDTTNVTTLHIEWPSGAIEEFTNVAPRQLLTIVEPSLRGAFGTDSLFHLKMTGNTNNTYRLEASDDLVNWTSLTNCAGAGPNAAIEFCDPEAPSAHASRYYRMSWPLPGH